MLLYKPILLVAGHRCVSICVHCTNCAQVHQIKRAQHEAMCCCLHSCRLRTSLMMQRCDSWCLCQTHWQTSDFQPSLVYPILSVPDEFVCARACIPAPKCDGTTCWAHAIFRHVYPAMERRNMLHTMFLMLRGFTTCLVNFQSYVLVNFKVMFGLNSHLECHEQVEWMLQCRPVTRRFMKYHE